MEKTNNRDYLYIITRVIHWVSALLFFILALTTGYQLNNVLNAYQRIDVYYQHMSLGLLFALLTVLRLFWLMFYRKKRAQFLGAWQRKAAHINFFILYTLMLSIVISGVIAVMSAGKDLQFFTYFEIPLVEWLVDDNAKFYSKESHQYLVDISYVFLFVHVCGAIMHYARPQIKRLLGIN